ncbi:MAG TPA: hypothetical protein PLW44_03670 [Chitinophagales bacterium]|nr:hypothetical protein [Chitinophagales bacterium]
MNPTDVIKSFKQGAANNCASIAIIKAAIHRYGIDNVYAEQISDNGDTQITMRDKTTFEISAKEVAKWAPKSKYIHINGDATLRTYEYALKCFAVLVKCYAIKEEVSIDEALDDICNDGLNSDYVYIYLGIPDEKISRLEFSDDGTRDLNQFKKHDGYLFYNDNHVAMASLDNYDEYGELLPLEEFQGYHRRVFKPGKDFWAYKLVE